MDIVNLEREKAVSRCLMHSIPLRIVGLDSASCYKYLINHPNKEIGQLVTVVHAAADEITNYWNRELIKNMVNVGLTICCKHEKYSKILSKVLTQLYDSKVEIKKYKNFNIVERSMIKILLKASDKILNQRTYTLDMAHELLSDCSNEAISFIHYVSSEAMKETLDDEEYARVSRMFEFLLYVVYLDTAYRDPFFWILDKIVREDMRMIIAKHVIKPFDWYVNVWVRGKELTSTLKKKGAIPQYAHSVVERRMCPAKQMFDLNKKLKK